jgi:hypothetical protein
MKRFGFATTALVLTMSLSSCAFFDNEARDKAACDRLSDLLTSQGSGSLPTDAPPSLIKALESEVLPMASGDLGGKIRDLIDAYKGLESESIFDQLGGGLDTLYYAGLVLERCVELSSSSLQGQ